MVPVDFKFIKVTNPYYQCLYPVLHLKKDRFRKELNRLMTLGVLQNIKQLQLGLPTFIVPKNRYDLIMMFKG